MSQRAEIINRINKAATLQEQAALVAELDAYDRQSREATASANSIDLTDAIVRQTLQPVAVHERSSAATDWLGSVTASDENASQAVTVEASLWYRRLSPEVKADKDEFAEQARGMARRTASAHGEKASAMYQEFLQYVAFLHQREAASGLPQVQQRVDSFENPAPTPLPQDVFDNFAPPVDPINAGTTGTETSERAPLLQEIMGEGQGMGQPEKPGGHDTAPQITWSGITPTGARTAGLLNEAGNSLFVPTVGISHMASLDDARNGTGIFAQASACGCPNGSDGEHLGDCPGYGGGRPMSDYDEDDWYRNAARREAASGLDQVQQVVDSFEEPDETPLPTEVAFPWILGPDAGGQANAPATPPPGVNPSVEKRREAFQRRAAYVAGLATRDPQTLTPQERQEVLAFTASLQKQADQWTQMGGQYHGPSAQNGPWTTPEGTSGSFSQGQAEGASDWPEEAPTYADASPTVPDFVNGHVQGYQDAAQANPYAGGAQPGQMPPGAGGMNNGYATHAASLQTTANQYIEQRGNQWVILQKGTGKVLSHHDSEEKAKESFAAMEMNKHSSLKVSAAFTSAIEQAEPEFVKGYKYATKWEPGKRLVTMGSAEFEAGLYAGMSDNPAHQAAWTNMHREAAAKYKKPEFLKRLAMHREFSKKASKHLTDLRVVGNYLQSTAATSTDLDTTAPSTSPSPTGQTPINGPGTRPPLAGQTDAAAPGGPSPYNGAEPFGQPVVPNSSNPAGTPTAISDAPGAAVDAAAMEHLSPQTLAFRKRVQASLVQATKVPVCNGCGEAFESREVANEVHGKNGCGTREDENTGYKMTPEHEAW